MTLALATRMVRSTDKRLLWKFAYNFGWKGMRSVQRFKKRLKEGRGLPALPLRLDHQLLQPALHAAAGSTWRRRRSASRSRTGTAWSTTPRAHGNYFFGILGGEPFLHPELMEMLAAHPGLLLPDLHQRPLRSPTRWPSRAAQAGQRDALISVEGDRDRERRAPRADANACSTRPWPASRPASAIA